MTRTTQTARRAPARLPAYTPDPLSRRRERLRGALAALTVLVVVVGVPAALVLAIGLPVPRSLPTRESLTGELEAMTILRILSVVVWLAWAHFVICLVVEWRAERRGAGLPGRVPFGSGTQSAARRLVASMLLLGGAATIAIPAAGSIDAERPAPASAPAAPSPRTADPVNQAIDPRSAPPVVDRPVREQKEQVKKLYDVKSREGRHYDTLWGIAERFLGDGLRYKEIYALNKGKLQPDGRKLTKPDLIHPGWVLELPSDAEGPGLRIVDPIGVPARGSGAPNAPTAGQRGSSAAGAAAVSPEVAGDEQGGLDLGSGLFGASLLAAGLAVGLRKRRGPYGGSPGGGVDADTEVGLRLAADESAASLIDRALRHLAAELAAEQRPLPEVYAAVLDDERLVIRFTPSVDLPPPAPWSASEDQRGWVIERGQADALTVDERVLAPFPGLATFGRHAGQLVLLDLEAAPGIISVGGEIGVARELAASVAVELATNLWSDEVRVTMVGFGDDLSAIAPGRLRHVDSLTEALNEVEARHERQRGALLTSGLESVLRGRQLRHDQRLCEPQFLVLSAPPAADEAARLSALVSDQRAAVGALTVGDVAAARWRFVVGADGVLDTGVLGITLDAQRLPVAHYRQVVELFRSADADAAAAPVVMLPRTRATGDEPGPAAPGAAIRPVAASHLTLSRPQPVEVRMLGDLEIDAPGQIDDARLAIAREVVAFVALQPTGAHPTVLASALWPRGASDAVTAAALSHVQEWLGRDDSGRHRFGLGDDGRWQLASDVRIDWDVFRALVSAAPGPDEERRLADALRLVRGPAWATLPAGRYAWLARSPVEADMRRSVVAAAHRAALLAHGRGDARAAEAPARAGLRLVPTSEVLWRDVLRAHALTGDRALLEQVADEMWRVLGTAAVRDSTAAETDALVAELLPGYRPKAA